MVDQVYVERRRYVGGDEEDKILRCIILLTNEYKNKKFIHTRAFVRMLKEYACEIENLCEGTDKTCFGQ